MILAASSLMREGFRLMVIGLAFSLMFFVLTGFKRMDESVALRKPASANRGRVLGGFLLRWCFLVLAGVGLIIMIVGAL